MNRFLHSRFSVFLAAVVAVGVALAYYSLGPAPTIESCRGLVPSWSAPWHIPAPIGLWAALAANAVIAVLLATLVKAHNVLRSMTMLPGAMFLYMQLAAPQTLSVFYPGLGLALVALLCVLLLYANYGDGGGCQRSVFLAFLLSSACTVFDVGFVALVPVLALACAQLKLLNPRTLLAMLMGLATPWIILLGFGIVQPGDIDFDSFGTLVSRGSASHPDLIGTVAVTMFVGIGTWMQNAVKYLGYNAQSRSMLSVLTVMLLAMMVAVMVDFGRAYDFLPLLNCMVALQIGHLFGVIYNQKKSFLAILTIAGIYIGFCLWTIATSL